MSAPRIIQIAVTAGGQDNMVDTLYALADDGSIWRLGQANIASAFTPDAEWVPLPTTPREVIA